MTGMRPQSINPDGDIKDMYICGQLCKVVELSIEPKLNNYTHLIPNLIQRSYAHQHHNQYAQRVKARTKSLNNI